LFGALVAHGPPACGAALAHAGAMDVVVGALQQQAADAARAQHPAPAHGAAGPAPPPPLSDLARPHGGSRDPGATSAASPAATAARLASLRTFEAMCAAAPGDSPELARGVAAVAQLLGEDRAAGAGEGSSSALLQARAVQVLRSAAQSRGCHAAIVAQGCGPLVDLLLDDQVSGHERARLPPSELLPSTWRACAEMESQPCFFLSFLFFFKSFFFIQSCRSLCCALKPDRFAR
jgi:hypothetical protein